MTHKRLRLSGYLWAYYFRQKGHQYSDVRGIIGDVTEERRGDQGSWNRKNKWESGHRSGQRAKGSVGIHRANGRTMAWLWMWLFKLVNRGGLREGIRPHCYLRFLSFHSASPTFWTSSKDSESWSFFLFLSIPFLCADGERCGQG